MKVTDDDIKWNWGDTSVKCPHCDKYTSFMSVLRGKCERCDRDITVVVM